MLKAFMAFVVAIAASWVFVHFVPAAANHLTTLAGVPFTWVSFVFLISFVVSLRVISGK